MGGTQDIDGPTESIEEVGEDGSGNETTTTTINKADGSVETTTEREDGSGNVIIIVETLIINSDGTTTTTTETKDSSGNTISIVTVEKDVSGKETSRVIVTVSVDTSGNEVR